MKIPEATPDSKNESLLAICLFAAFADGEKSDTEREEVRRLATEFGLTDFSAISRDILMRKVSLESVVAGLTDSHDRLLAYELALGVCEAGGTITEDENQFLGDLRRALDVGERDADRTEASVAELALAEVSAPDAIPTVAASTDNSGMILKYAILNGALELLPESLATIAIIPMQMKMVYRIGKNHGVELDRSNVKEFPRHRRCGPGFAGRGRICPQAHARTWQKDGREARRSRSRSAYRVRHVLCVHLRNRADRRKILFVRLPTRRGEHQGDVCESAKSSSGTAHDLSPADSGAGQIVGPRHDLFARSRDHSALVGRGAGRRNPQPPTSAKARRGKPHTRGSEIPPPNVGSSGSSTSAGAEQPRGRSSPLSRRG